jgi:diguanylate cyclase (GGDEF)-like protein
MRRWLPVAVVLVCWAAAACAAGPAPLTTLRAIHALSNEQAAHELPVEFEATVTYFRGSENTLFVQDGDVAIYVDAPAGTRLVPGDRVLIRGTTHESFRPFVRGASIALLGHGATPKPLPATFDELIHARRDCRRVTISALVRAADVVMVNQNASSIDLQLLMDGGTIEARVDSDDDAQLKDLLDAEVRVVGVVSGVFDGKHQLPGIILHVSSPGDVKIVKRARTSPWSLQVTPMGEALTSYRVRDLRRRIRVFGTITYYQPGSAMVLQSGAKSLWIDTKTIAPMRVGDLADAVGFADVRDGSLTLTHAEVRDARVQAPIDPQLVTWSQLTSNGIYVWKHFFDLVSIEGQVVSAVQGAAEGQYVLASDGRLFSAIYRRPDAESWSALPKLEEIPVGSKVRVTGICIPHNSDSLNGPEAFDILLRSFDDIAVVGRPSPLNTRNLILVVGVLLVLMALAGARGWSLERRVRRHATALATRIEAEANLQGRRARILEDINGSRPLAEVVEQVTELVSFQLQGAPCWCQIQDGARLGVTPAGAETRGAASQQILSRSGMRLGTLFAAVATPQSPTAHELEALSIGAGLVELAIETRRLYSDLRRRSEFDQLTDIHNRFSLESRLNELIDQARQTAGVFGLIYIDLDDFKQVNDLYGHHAGDLYLQEVAVRMKRQLRSGDMLARLGGDEFAVLVPEARNRADVQDVATRLERSFEKPFDVNGYSLHGAASVGVALYPEDGASKDTLLSAADAGMYVAKHTRKQAADVPSHESREGARAS